MEQKYDDTFLARWLADELTSKELQEFQNSEEYQKYAQIVETVDSAEVPEFDIEKSLQATKDQIASQTTFKKSKTRIIPLWSYAAAASVAILFFVYSFFFSSAKYTTDFGEKIAFELPDKSEVDLNSGSIITFKKQNWDENRALKLEGEAFFKVQKGSTFSVVSSNGIVKVLGTQFVVNSRSEFYNIICYEGRVEVTVANNKSFVLSEGEAFVLQKNEPNLYKVEGQEPSWISEQSTFENIRIEEVVAELERQYDITITGKENLKETYFTGRFTHKNLKQAIQTVFLAMEINYIINENGDVIIKK